MPLDWRELDDKALRPDGVTIRNIFERLEKLKDPWKDFRARAASLKTAAQKLRRL